MPFSEQIDGQLDRGICPGFRACQIIQLFPLFLILHAVEPSKNCGAKATLLLSPDWGKGVLTLSCCARDPRQGADDRKVVSNQHGERRTYNGLFLDGHFTAPKVTVMMFWHILPDERQGERLQGCVPRCLSLTSSIRQPAFSFQLSRSEGSGQRIQPSASSY